MGNGSAVDRRHVLSGLVAGLTGLTGLPGAALAQPPAIEPTTISDTPVTVRAENPIVTLRTWSDAAGRPATEVFVNGQGPFRFLADTGSNTTVITPQLAAILGLETAQTAQVLGVTGITNAPVLRLDSIRCGATLRESMRVVILGGDALDGLHGVLGMDMFASRRLRFDFRSNTFAIEEARRRQTLPVDMPVDFRHGLLIETPARVGGVRARCIVDTGSDTTLLNKVLLDALLDPDRVRASRDPALVLGVGNQNLTGTWIRLPRVNALGMHVTNMVAIGIDAPIFQEWELAGTPTMLVGMDLLKGLETFQVDYRRGRIQLLLREGTARG
jgi:predicted aspartyl protease